MSLYQAAQEAETSAAFERVPIVYVPGRSPWWNLIHFATECIPSDLKDVDSIDPSARGALGDQVRDACMNVGFLYGMAFRPHHCAWQLS